MDTIKKKSIETRTAVKTLLGALLITIITAFILLFMMFPAAFAIGLIQIGIWLSPNPPRPEITYGEFPFRLEYSVGEEVFVVEDTFIAQFDGFGQNEGVGKYRRWVGWLANGGGTMVHVLTDGHWDMYITVGNAQYYMNDQLHPWPNPLSPNIIDVFTGRGLYNPRREELIEKHQIELINWEFSDPIVNSFR